MKNVALLAIIILQVGLANAQRGQPPNGSQGGQGGGQMSMPDFNVENAVGILKYKPKKVFKKLKIQADSNMLAIATFITAYNQTIDEIHVANSDKLGDLENIVNTKRKDAMANRDTQAMRNIQAEAMQQLAPIRTQLIIVEQNLNFELKQVLTEKQYKKWEKYQNSKKEAL